MTNNIKIKWKAKDYVGIISLFVLQCIVFYGIMLLCFLMYYGSISKFIELYTQDEFIKNNIYLGVAEVLVHAIIAFYYFTSYKADDFKPGKVIMIFCVINISTIACFAFGLINVYLRPFALCALLILLIAEKRMAVFINCVFSVLMLLTDIFTRYSLVEYYVPFIIGFISGITAVYIIGEEGSRIKVLTKSILVSVPVIVSALCLEFTLDFEKVGITALYALLSGILSNAFMMILLPIFEVVFGAITNFRLAELTDHKSKLIKLLIERAPGTFNHTIIVAMLAEACSNAINENPLLARACAYYHDIGKIKKAEFFAENQASFNPHDDLLPELSTDIIRAHAKDGADLIRKWHLPEVIAETAEQHHGTLPIRYFYAKARKFTDGDVDIEDFSYYGPKPTTKINAIIMICDACEAKVRTINNRTHENVDKAVKDIIEERMDLDQFTDCDITFRELDIIRKTITNTLAGVYHERVKYPKLKIGSKNGN